MPSPVPGPTRDATAANRGLVSTLAQTFAGLKTFLDGLRLALRPTVNLPVGGAELRGAILYDTTADRPKVHNGTAWVSVAMSVGGGGTSLEEHVASTEAHPGTSITLVNGSLPEWADGTQISATDVGSALVSIVSDLASEASGEAGAFRVGAAPDGTLTGTTVQDQIYQLDEEKVSAAALADNSGASTVGATPGGSLSSSTVQGQLNELSLEKAALSGAEFTGPTSVVSGNGALTLKSGTADCVYMQFYTRTSSPLVRSCYFGFAFAGSETIQLNNEIVNGSINLQVLGTGNIGLYPGSSGVVQVAGSGKLEATSTLKGTALILTSNPASTTPVTNTLHASSICKAWGSVTTSASPMVADGENIASVALVGSTLLRVTFAAPMANANYAVECSTSDGSGVAKWETKNVAYVDLYIYRPGPGSVVDLTVGPKTIDFSIQGRQ